VTVSSSGAVDRPTVWSGAASTGLASVLGGSPRTVTVLATFPRAVYLTHPGGVLALETADGAGLPNGITIAEGSDRSPFERVRVGTTGEVGGGAVTVDGATVRVVRWRRARPALRAVTPDALRAAAGSAEAHLAARAPALPADLHAVVRDVTGALGTGEVADAVELVRRGLLGRGPGLTPSGDDLLAGLIAGVASLGAALGVAGGALTRRVDELADALVVVAPEATTAISATLLDHAARGEVAVPAAQLLHALTGDGPVAGALDRLLTFGSSSGRDLAVGLLAAAELVVDALAPDPPRRCC
jgi:hypothetical protein